MTARRRAGLRLGLSGLALAAIAWAGLSALGARRWAAATRVLTSRLEAGRIDAAALPAALSGAVQAGPAARYDPRQLDGLPAPVQRYFRSVLTPGQPLVAAASIDMAGRFNRSTTGAQWQPFCSRQRVVTRRPGFVWDARMALAPGLPVRVVDGYIAGEGLLHAALFGLFTVAEVRGAGEIARGELMRYLAEAAWYPTALLPGQGVRWAEVDAASADATVADGATALTLRFHFDAAGLIVSARAEARGATVGGKTVMLPWEGRWSDYAWRAGMRVPMSGEAAWLPPEGRRPYFQGRVTSLAFEFAP